MPSDYEAITQQNIRRLGEDTDQYKPLINLYANPTHFIYELLQNADDYGAKTVSFQLHSESLVLEHNGTPFEEKNVRSITDIGRSTSAGDFTKTGCFGLGFKSVFAFTATPQIISGDESFEIHRLSRVRALVRPANLEPAVTRIVLPFNHLEEHPDYVDRERTPEDAFTEIGEKLRDIGLRTLLFTKNIEEVKWSVPNAEGHYLKEVRGEQTYLTDSEKGETYLTFSRDVEWEGEKLNPVSISFRLEGGRIVGVGNRSLFVLFETALETHLGFLVNGAFRTTPSRENIRYEDELNQYLIQQLAELLGDSLKEIKRHGMLDVSFLRCLPIKVKDISSWNQPADWQPNYPGGWPFLPLFEKVRTCLQNEKYLPTDTSKRYVSAQESVLARGEELRSIIPYSVLPHIWDAPKMWLSGDITEKLPELRNYLIHCLRVKEVRPEELIGMLPKRVFESQPPEWLVQFYLYVASAQSFKSSLRAKNVPCIPLQSGEWVYANEVNVVFPLQDMVQASSGINFLRSDIATLVGVEGKEDVRSFLEDLGVHELGEEDAVKSLLSLYYDLKDSSEILLQDHLDHIRTFIAYWKDEAWKAKNILASKAIFLADDYLGIDLEEKELDAGDLVSYFRPAGYCYIDQPLENTMLADVLDTGTETSKSLVSHCYVALGDDFLEFAKDLGVQYQLSPEPCDVMKNFQRIEMSGSENYRCSRSDWQIPSAILNLLQANTDDANAYDLKFQASELVWKMMTSLDPKYFTATYQKNSHKEKQDMQSQLIQQLTAMRWLGDRGGKWCRPSELTTETLYTGATEDDPTLTFDVSTVSNGWLQLVQFGQSEIKQEAAKTLGLDYSDCQLIEKVKQEDPDFLDKLREQFLPIESVDVAEIDFPEQLNESVNKPGKTEIDEQYLTGDSGEVKKPGPRGDKLADEIQADKDEEKIPKPPRLPRLTKSIECKDRQTRQYLLEWYGGKCQICGKTWAKRNGKPYFVAAYMLEVRKGRWLDRPGNAICLCADHFAQWRHASKEQVCDVNAWILAQKLAKEGGDASLKLKFYLLGKRVGIKYCEKHFLELRTLVSSGSDVVENRGQTGRSDISISDDF